MPAASRRGEPRARAELEIRRAVSSSVSGARLIRWAFCALAPKVGVPLEELRAGGTEHEQRHPLRPFGEMLEKGEKGLVRPVQVLEDEDRLPRFCPPFEDAAPGRKRLLLGGGLAADADERRQTSLEPREVGIVLGQRSVELGVRLLRRVGLENPALGLHDLPERPEGDPLSIGKATALAPARKRRSCPRDGVRARRRGGSCRRRARRRSSRAEGSAAASLFRRRR